MLKEEEYFEYLRGNELSGGVELGWTRAQDDWRSRYNQIAANVVGMSERYAALSARNVPTNKVEHQEVLSLGEDLVVARTAFRSLLDDIRQAANSRKETKSVNLSVLRGIQSTLKTVGQDTVLLHYVAGEERLHIILTTPLIQVARTNVVRATELNRNVFALCEVLRNPRKDPRRLAGQLYQWLIRPVAEDLKQAHAKTLLVSLDGALRYLPLAALYDGRHYVAEDFGVVLFAQAANYKLETTFTNSWSVAAMGLTQAESPFGPLPYVRDELEGIVSQNGLAGGVLPGLILLDDEFVPAKFGAAVRAGHPVIHIASHFVFDPIEAANSFLLLGRHERLSLLDLQTQDISFGDVDLLTLSACETAVSAEHDGGGGELEGFAVEAQNLGARSVLATLWPVADRSTCLFMQRFYQEHQRARGVSKSEALHRAQLALLRGELKQTESPSLFAVRGVRLESGEPTEADFTTNAAAPFAHPFYWAPFVLMGNWR